MSRRLLGTLVFRIGRQLYIYSFPRIFPAFITYLGLLFSTEIPLHAYLFCTFSY